MTYKQITISAVALCLVSIVLAAPSGTFSKPSRFRQEQPQPAALHCTIITEPVAGPSDDPDGTGGYQIPEPPRRQWVCQAASPQIAGDPCSSDEDCDHFGERFCESSGQTPAWQMIHPSVNWNKVCSVACVGGLSGHIECSDQRHDCPSVCSGGCGPCSAGETCTSCCTSCY